MKEKHLTKLGANHLIYILLLRGINVGGKNKVSMSDLKKLLLGVGFEDVNSYINSGNLFFASVEKQESCVSKIRDILEGNYDFSIPFALLTKEEYLKEREELPDWWNGEYARKDVLFFRLARINQRYLTLSIKLHFTMR